MFYQSFKLILTVFIIFLSGCQQQSVHLDTSANEAGALELFAARTHKPWKVYVYDENQSQALARGSVSLRSGDIRLQYTTKDSRKDALEFSWKDHWRAGVSIKKEQAIDLSEFLETGALSLDINVLELARGGVTFVMNCGSDCERRLPFTEQAFAWAGQGWKNIRIDLSCFVQEGDDFSAVATPFAMETGGTGQVAIANVQLLKKAVGNVRCPEYKTVAVTAQKLNEYWARDWWEPRHKEKLERIKQGNVDLLFIGDSITEGWEKEGKSIWGEYYADRNAVNLGYGGDRTENVLWRLRHGEVDGISPKVAVLMIGTNNTGHRHEKPEYTANGIRVILEELRARLPETKILLLAVFPRAEKPDAKLRRINSGINSIIANYADNQKIFYLDISQQFLAEDGTLSRDVMPDLLHLNAASYRTWAEAMEPLLQQLLAESMEPE